ncbi:hypothetical protein BD626DRAFT_578582 [Schizophyllum amplum]|uniref:Uncharacterized protein n=1 Tax=Schizophyllum amplum TaxID=97359 RepID=A0A550BRX8_9AGAR|nr:hypothetical protein BD626DRAFT_578582 [Auriculariopsis ampla]
MRSSSSSLGIFAHATFPSPRRCRADPPSSEALSSVVHFALRSGPRIAHNFANTHPSLHVKSWMTFELTG